MLQSVSASKLPSEFDPFLFSLIDGEQTGRPVSVLSALARSDLDPWKEAAKLARLPTEAATQSLVSTIVSLRGNPLAGFDHNAVAARLVALLPKHEGLRSQQSRELAAVISKGNQDTLTFAFVISGLLMAFTFGHQVTATNSPPAGKAKETLASLSGTQPPPSKQIARADGKGRKGLPKTHSSQASEPRTESGPDASRSSTPIVRPNGSYQAWWRSGVPKTGSGVFVDRLKARPQK